MMSYLRMCYEMREGAKRGRLGKWTDKAQVSFGLVVDLVVSR